MRRVFPLLLVWSSGPLLFAQDGQHLADRHARIEKAYDADDHAATIREIDAQVKESVGSPWADSLHRYVYKYGRSQRKMNGVAEGIAAAERILALVRARRVPLHEINALFDMSWLYYEVGEAKQCVRVDSLAMVVADSHGTISYTERGRARQYLAFDYSVIGDHKRSAWYAEQALVQYAKADTIDPLQLAEAHNTSGVAYWHLGRVRDAEKHYQQALEVLGDGTDEESLARKVSINGNLGVMWQNAGDLPRAKAYYQESMRHSDRLIAGTLQEFTREEAILNRSRTYLNLATVHHQFGDMRTARELLGIAWKDRSSVLQPDDPQLLVIRDRMADVEIDGGSLEKAEELVSGYAAACEAKFGRRSEEYVASTSKLGEIAYRKGQWARADSLFTLSISSGAGSMDGNTDTRLANTLQRRARMKIDAGRFSDAMDDIRRAREVLVNVHGPAHHKVAFMDVLLAEAAFLNNDHTLALESSQAAIDLLGDRIAALRTGHGPLTFASPHVLPDAIYWNIRAKRARAAVGTVVPEWSADLDLAIAAIARNKTAVRDDASKLLLVSARKALFELATDLAYDAYVKSGSEADVERLLALSEADRAILLKGRLNGFAGLRFAGLPDSIVAREQELLAALDVDEQDRNSATRLLENEQAYAAFILQLEQLYPNYFALRYGEPAPTLKEIREKLLNPERQLLAYVRSSDNLYIVLVGLSNASVVRARNEGVTEAVAAMNVAITRRDQPGYTSTAHGLYERVFAPLADRVTAPELFIIPDGALHTINFEALLTRPVDGADFRSSLLLQRHTVSYLLSASTALRFADLAQKPLLGTLALAPGFDDGLKQAYLAGVKDTAAVDRHFLKYVRQPFATSTARLLGSLLSAKVLLGSDASETRFRELAQRYGILHLGTHAEMNANAPMYSRFVLSKDGAAAGADADGYLHAYEIYEFDLRAQLAVLTACETGVGREDGGEGIRSLGYGFAYAGCPSSVMSLWKIDEKVSSDIITRFYEHLAKGMPKNLALRQAKLDHLADASDELAQPYYWGGMVLVGAVQPLEIGFWGRFRWWVIGGIVLIMGGGVALWRVRRGSLPADASVGKA